MTGDIKGLETAVEGMLAKEGNLTTEIIRKWIAVFRTLPPFVINDDQAEHLARVIEARHAVTMNLGAVLKSRDYKPWLEAAKINADFYYWERYSSLLKGKGFSRNVVDSLHADTDRTLGMLQNPALDGPWDRRGMVVGHVQSGKTANYIGLICKAADAGYRVIIVIAGIHNNLRNQTQKRIDEGFVGRDSARLLSRGEDKFVGVGKINALRRPMTFTNSVKDFNKALATGVGIPLKNLTEPAVFVIKKNATTLKNLTDWLSEHNASGASAQIGEPMLLIDDEADNASINTGYDRDEVTRINGQIRGLLQMFSRSCYVAYTATPFANIFIDPDTDDKMRGADLFPRHFIVSLDPPTNYFGPHRVFGAGAANIIRHITDNEYLLPLKHAIDHPVEQVPPSLLDAMSTFVVGRAIRLVRGHDTAHCSMLVNASRFTGVQGRIASALGRELDRMQRSLSVNGSLPAAVAERDPAIADLHATFDREFKDVGTSWAATLNRLHEAAAPIKIVEVNSASSAALSYDSYADTGLAVIAIGGYALSRGLTLEGLMVSYFLRNSVMYDTLMQMGRWFGYRDGYEDLCRLWLPEEAEGWYVKITEYIDELREDFRKMAAADATPEEFGLKVRKHPGSLLVTARNKMGAGETVVFEIGLAKHFVETAVLRAQPDGDGPMARNREAVGRLIAALTGKARGLSGAKKVESAGWLLSGADVGPVKQFISEFAHHPLSMLTDPVPVRKYIEDREATELKTWDVLFVSPTNKEATLPDVEGYGVKVALQVRTRGNKSGDAKLLISNKQRVASRGVERIGLTREQMDDAESEFRANKLAEGPEPESWNYPDRIYRAKRLRPLLIIHLLQINEEKKPFYTKPIVAWSISFPDTKHPEETVKYVVTTTWLRENFRAEPDEEETSDDT